MKKKLFMLKKLLRDFLLYPPKIYLNIGNTLDYYYFLFSGNPKKLNRLISTFDNNGVPLNKSYIDVQSTNLHYYPISIGQYGLAIFNRWIKNNHSKDLEIFSSINRWFVENVIHDELLGAYWLTEVPKPEFKITTPWKSAFTQSRAISVLLRGWQMTRESNYLKLASKALIPFTIPIESGGVAVDLTEEMAFYEEYVAEKPTRILDGAMFSLFGVYDFIRATKELKEWEESHQLAKEIFRKGVNGLKFWLPKFDMGYWVFYNRCEIEGYPQNDPCTIGYLRLVSAQLEIMANLTGEKIFIEYSYKFKGYLKPWNILKMYREKFIALKKLNRL
jgi:hypothetical protein